MLLHFCRIAWSAGTNNGMSMCWQLGLARLARCCNVLRKTLSGLHRHKYFWNSFEFLVVQRRRARGDNPSNSRASWASCAERGNWSRTVLPVSKTLMATFQRWTKPVNGSRENMIQKCRCGNAPTTFAWPSGTHMLHRTWKHLRLTGSICSLSHSLAVSHRQLSE